MPRRERGGPLTPSGPAAEGRSAQEAPQRDRNRSRLRPRLLAARSSKARAADPESPPDAAPGQKQGSTHKATGAPTSVPEQRAASQPSSPPRLAPQAVGRRAATSDAPPADDTRTAPFPLVRRSGSAPPGRGLLARPPDVRGPAELFTGAAVPDGTARRVPVNEPADERPDDYVAPQLSPRARRRSATASLALLGVAVLTVVAHAVAATFASAWVATASEARFAVAVMAIRDATIPGVPLPLWDRLAAIQIAAVQLVLPAGDPVDTARWACLALGALATLILWPALRAADNSVPATAITVGTLGVALPLLMLHSGVTTAVVGAVWLSLAAALAARSHLRAAGVAAVLAMVSVPLVAGMLLAMAAVVILTGFVALPSPALRRPAGIGAAALALGVVLAAVLPGGPLVASSGPAVPTAVVVVAALVVVAIVVAAGVAEGALLSVLVAAVPLVVVGLFSGPSRAAAGVLITPVLAVALVILIDHSRVRRVARPLRFVAVAALVVVLGVPLAVAAATPIPRGAPLTTWVLTQTADDAIVVADVLDRAELQTAGFPTARLRSPTDPPAPGALRLISERPGATVVPCPTGAVLASTSSGAGGAREVVCGQLTPATVAEQRARARLGLQLTANPSVRLEPAATAALRDGVVDPRLMLTLAALTGAHRIGVAAFPPVPLDAPEALRRTVVLSAFDGGAPASSPLLRRWLAAQQAPFVPTGISVDGSDLVFGYPAPSPTGLLPP